MNYIRLPMIKKCKKEAEIEKGDVFEMTDGCPFDLNAAPL